MLRADAAVIGGTGIGRRFAQMGGRVFRVLTPYGPVTGRAVELEGVRLALVQRHAFGHSLPPHCVNYRAVADGLRRMGVRVCLSSGAVGSLREDWTPGTMAIVTDFVDLTGRRLTLFDGEVRHTDFTRPLPACDVLKRQADEAGHLVEHGATYVGMDGPRYETAAEITMLRRIGGDVVGMTAASEAAAMGEAGVPYGCLAVVTNLACGLELGGLGHEDVETIMTRMQGAVLELLLGAAQRGTA